MMQAMRMIMRSSNICESFVPNSVYTQCIRWKRKPIWLPTAKSKMFRIPKRPVVPIEDALEIRRLFNIYKTYMSSLRLHINIITEENKVSLDNEKLAQIEEENFQICKTINDKWNADIAKIREARLVAMRQINKEEILNKMIEIEETREKLKKEADEEIKKFKEEVATFITPENIDAAIEECLANVVNHNRALDLDGNWYDEKYPAIPDIKETPQPMVQQ